MEKWQYVFVSELRPFKCQWPFFLQKSLLGMLERKKESLENANDRWINTNSPTRYIEICLKNNVRGGGSYNKKAYSFSIFWKTSPRSSHVLNKRLIMRESNKAPLSLVHNCLTMILLWLIIIILYSCYKVSSVLESSSSAEARLINQLPSTQPNQCCPSPLSSFAIFYPYSINPFRA